MIHSQESFHKDLEGCEPCGQGGEIALMNIPLNANICNKEDEW